MDKNKFQLNVEITSNQNESDFNLYSILKKCFKLFSFVIKNDNNFLNPYQLTKIK